MKAMISDNGVAGLRVGDVPDPEPAAGEVRIRVLSSAVNPADWKVLDGDPSGFILHGGAKPVVVGYDVCGIVDKLGAGVTTLAVGTRVAGFLSYTRATKQGAFAELVVTPADCVAPVPDAVDNQVAGVFPTGALTALQMIRDLGKLPPEGRLLVVGAAGGVGTFAVGVGRALGAKVTAVCSTGAIEFVRSLGAEAVIDRAKEDPLKASGTFDVIADTAAAWSFSASRHLLTPEGAFVTTLPSLSFAWGKVVTLVGKQRCEFVSVRSRAADLAQVGTWIAAGMKVPIDSSCPVRDLRAALERQQRGGMKGKIAIDVAGGW